MRHDFFLAHAGADKDQAVDLYDRLRPDVHVFLDCKDLLPGDVWPDELARAQRASLATVILVSPRTETAFYWKDEVHSAIALHRADPAEHRAVPVYLDGTPRDPMAEGDGFDLIRWVRSLPPDQGGNVPALALTAYATVDDRVRVLNAGYQMHLPKPIEPYELARVVALLARPPASVTGGAG